jgi:hypothetical protein
LIYQKHYFKVNICVYILIRRKNPGYNKSKKEAEGAKKSTPKESEQSSKIIKDRLTTTINYYIQHKKGCTFYSYKEQE